MSGRLLAAIVAAAALCGACGSTFPVHPTEASPRPAVPREDSDVAFPAGVPALPPESPLPVEPRPPPRPDLHGKTIVVDAGHGGRDPGAIRNGVTEKIVTLGIASRLASSLSARGARVVMTRRDDSYPSLAARAALADREDAHLLVSIHADSAENPSARGPAVWIARQALGASERVARSVISSMEREGLAPRGIRRADFQVLVRHARPSILVECGFLTNAADAAKLADPGYQRKLALAIADGVTAALASPR